MKYIAIILKNLCKYKITHRHIAITFLLLLHPLLPVAEELNISSKVNKTNITAEEEILFSISVSGNYTRTPKLNTTDLKDFIITSSKTYSNYTKKSGISKMTTKFTFTIRPKKEGILTIAPIELESSGKIYTTKPIEIKVNPPALNKEKEIPVNNNRTIVL